MYKLKNIIILILIVIEAIICKPLFKWKNYREGYIYGRPEQIHLSYGIRPDQMVIILIIYLKFFFSYELLFFCLYFAYFI